MAHIWKDWFTAELITLCKYSKLKRRVMTQKRLQVVAGAIETGGRAAVALICHREIWENLHLKQTSTLGGCVWWQCECAAVPSQADVLFFEAMHLHFLKATYYILHSFTQPLTPSSTSSAPFFLTLAARFSAGTRFNTGASFCGFRPWV